MITRKDIEKMVDGQVFETVGLVKSYAVRPTKTNSKYLDGTLELKGSVSFKVWAGDLLDELERCEYQGTICHIKGKVNEYQGKKSVILSDVKALENGAYAPEDFFEEKYNITAYVDGLSKAMEKNCSEEALTLYTKIMGDIYDRFTVEFAARGHHDAVKSGLLVHTYKVICLVARTVKIYPALLSHIDKDLLYLGTFCHDIGKIYEYTNGAIIGNGLLVSHNTFGVEMLASYKNDIIKLKGEDFYYRLLAIVQQHHGEWGERPRTLEAYIIHMLDNVESKFQAINEVLDSGMSTVSIDDYKLI